MEIRTCHSKLVQMGKVFIMVNQEAQFNSAQLLNDNIRVWEYFQFLGFVTLTVGLYTNYASSWSQTVNISGKEITGYEICHLNKENHWFPENTKCPSISLERYFVAILIICFILSATNLVLSFLYDLKSNLLKYVDIGYHILTAVLLIVAGIVYIVSARQINHLFSLAQNEQGKFNTSNLNLCTQEKYGNGVSNIKYSS